jgi:uncharacterized membrane protein
MSEQPPENPYGAPPPGGQPPQYPQQPPPGGQPPYPQQPGWGQQPPPPSYGAGPGGPEPYSAPTAIGYGWSKFRANAGPFLLVGLLYFVSQGVISTAGAALAGGGSAAGDSMGPGVVGAGFSLLSLVFNIAAAVVGILIGAAVVRGALDAVDGQQVSVGGMFQRWDVAQVLIAALLVGIAQVVGFALFVLPGIAVVFFAWFTNYFIVDRRLSAIDGIKSSFRFVADNAGSILLLALLSFLCIIAGVVACLVGLLVAYPVVVLAAAYTFRTLQGHPVAP